MDLSLVWKWAGSYLATPLPVGMLCIGHHLICLLLSYRVRFSPVKLLKGISHLLLGNILLLTPISLFLWSYNVQ